jgi:hypothetical protein
MQAAQPRRGSKEFFQNFRPRFFDRGWTPKGGQMQTTEKPGQLVKQWTRQRKEYDE